MSKYSRFDLFNRREIFVFILLLAVIIFLSLTTTTFLTTNNLQNVSRNFAWIAIPAFGESFVIIIGGIDLIERDKSATIIITDFKTSARAYSNDEVNKNFQLTLYEMALKANGYEDSNILLRFDCLIKTKQPKFESFYTTRDITDEIRARRKIIEVARGISKGIFIPNDSPQNWKCKGCSFKKNCDEWFMEAA